MPGTPRTISYLEGKFETGDIPTQQDFYDLFASYLHYQLVVQVTGSSTDAVMSQKAVTDEFTALLGGVPLAGNTLNKLYELIIGVGQLVGDFDASSGFLPTTGTGLAGAIDKGDYWLITTGGTIAGLGTLAVGDILFAKQANATLAAHFFYLPFATLVANASETVKGVVEEATDAEVTAGTASGGTGAKLFVTPAKLLTWFSTKDATESAKGVAEIATQAETDTGTDDARIVTAKKLAGQSQKPTHYSATASGTDTYTATIAPAITAYTAGQRFYITISNTNTGPSTINLNSLGAKDIKKNFNENLRAGDLVGGQIVEMHYDGTNFQIIGGGASLQAQIDGISAVRSVIHLDTTPTSLTGVTGLTKVKSFFIPAGTFQAGDQLYIKIVWSRPSGAQTTTTNHRAALNDTDDLVTATPLIGDTPMTNTAKYSFNIRTFLIPTDTSFKGYSPSNASISDELNATNNYEYGATFAFDTDGYLVISANPATSGDTITCESVLIERLRP